jgi:hypothetical protein
VGIEAVLGYVISLVRDLVSRCGRSKIKWLRKAKAVR